MENLITIENLIEGLRKLPGVGYKSAERMAYSILEMKKESRDEIISSLQRVDKISLCPTCGSFKEKDFCPFCDDENKEKDKIVVVSSFKDALAFEKLHVYFGLYHILGGVINPSKGIGINDIKVDSLIKRIKDGNIKEVIIGLNPTLEGETTALFICKALEEFNIKITRLAYGLPMGGQLDYLDERTLELALKGRTLVRKD